MACSQLCQFYSFRVSLFSQNGDHPGQGRSLLRAMLPKYGFHVSVGYQLTFKKNCHQSKSQLPNVTFYQDISRAFRKETH